MWYWSAAENSTKIRIHVVRSLSPGALAVSQTFNLFCRFFDLEIRFVQECQHYTIMAHSSIKGLSPYLL